MRKWISVIAVAALLASASLASAAVVVYDATIEIEWNNSYVGTRLNVDPNATVTVDYTGGGAFEIIALTYSSNVPGVGTLSLSEAGSSTGTIAAGVATGTLGYSGSLGPYTANNVGGSYSGAVGGLAFSAGDVYELQGFHNGTTNFPLGLGNWDHLSALDDGPPDPDYGTRIIFGAPEPVSLMLLLPGVALLRRRR